jgi:hypothetical protein
MIKDSSLGYLSRSPVDDLRKLYDKESVVDVMFQKRKPS